MKTMYEQLGISAEVYEFCRKIEEGLEGRFREIDRIAEYNQMKVLLAMQKNRVSASTGEEVVACGLSEYIPGTDLCMEDVFERADAAMYENKKKLKEEREDNAGETSGI